MRASERQPKLINSGDEVGVRTGYSGVGSLLNFYHDFIDENFHIILAAFFFK